MSDIEKTLKIYRYWITLEDGDWSYIGKSALKYRSQRCGNKQTGKAYRCCPTFWAAIQKYGFSSFNYEVLEKDLDSVQAKVREEYWIQHFNSIEHGFNENNGVLRSEAAREKQSKSLFGKQHSEETKQKISKSCKGRHLSDETKQKISKAIYQADLQGNIIHEFSSMSEAAETLGICKSQISQCCNGHLKTAGGYTFQLK